MASYGNGSQSYPSYGYGATTAGAGGGINPMAGAGGGYGYPPQATTTTTSSSPSSSPYNTNGTSNLRRRTTTTTTTSYSTPSISSSSSTVIKKLDFMFPKIDHDYRVASDRGGVVSLAAVFLMVVLGLGEITSWIGENSALKEHMAVSTDLHKRMRINMNITFPALACEDLHVDAMDVAGDSQIDVEDTLVKKQLHLDGTPRSAEEIRVETNQHREEQEKKERVLKEKLPSDYCGPCFGAQEEDGQCCQTCDEVLEAYKKKRWKSDLLLYTAEQCVREGRDKKEPKKMKQGQGCNLSGYMTVNRVAGNFHIAMGEGVERDGRHIHTFLPEDSPNFNASHTIHQLSFGPGEEHQAPMNGITKHVANEHGTTGLFQYFIKVVPTTYRGADLIPESAREAAEMLPSLYEEVEKGKEKASDGEMFLETNRYFFTERFRPLMKEMLKDEHREEDDPDKAAVDAGHKGTHSNADHHKVQNSVLPGVFFIYEIYPFAVEITRNRVSVTHLLIRLVAIVGGIFTCASWLDSAIQKTGKMGRRKQHPLNGGGYQ